jgi:hypothetical protein
MERKNIASIIAETIKDVIDLVEERVLEILGLISKPPGSRYSYTIILSVLLAA